jgi:two-component system nitrogen regulation response regulator NtrX
VDVRVLAATNRDLEKAVGKETFREDLYFRLAVVPITVPPLRERAEDVPLLVARFAAQVASETGRKPKPFDPGALEALARHPFPGNVRELRNLVERLVIMSPGASVTAADAIAVLPAAEPAPAGASRMAEAVREFERREIETALAAEGGSMTRAAARLGIERSHLYKKMRKLGWRKEKLEG